MKNLIAGILVLLAFFACTGRGGEESAAALRPFPYQQVPPALIDPAGRSEWMAEHYWDAYFSGSGLCDSSALLGVLSDDLAQAMANFCAVLDACPLSVTDKAVGKMFTKMEAKHASDTTLNIFVRFSELATLYFYDPNSPLRDEDYYLPYVKRLCESPWTPQDMLGAYRFEAQTCSLNRRGQKAPDFRFKTREGKILHLYGTRADYTILFFSNPGCGACGEIVEQLKSLPYLEGDIAAGKLAVLNIYIDEDLAAWRAHTGDYPSSWQSGYDPSGVIRSNRLYFVRAIPSLYLLDSEKRIVMKDAPTEKLTTYLNNLKNN
ncbi:MAG: DUF5106 domain-containing protein [Bacteroidales bacterium]|nr:DUF5106 domain-containing protein [Bacteroidales bacterium]